MTKINNTNRQTKATQEFPLEVPTPIESVPILTLPPSKPRVRNDLVWADLLPKEAEGLGLVLESIVQSTHPYDHQAESIQYLLNSPANNSGLIINGGTYSGKSLSFNVPGIVKILTGETDFFVVFYPSKQLLLDQFDRMKELVVKLEEQTGKRLTVKMYSGDTNRATGSTVSKQAQKKELYETEQHPPNIILAIFDKFWYQRENGKENPLLDKINSCKYMVFDEIHAFEGFAAGIIKGFIQIHKKNNPMCQVVLSSATIDSVDSFRDDFLQDSGIITCPPVRGEHEFIGITKEHSVPFLADLWHELDTLPGKFALVFMDSKEKIELLAERLCAKLKQNHPFFEEITVAIIHADLPYAQRKKILDEIKKGTRNRIKILISSSVLELGVNIPNVQIVVNIGIPITQKDGIVQRFARNRSNPNERRVNVCIFDLANSRDNFYWHHLEILRTILETNACNPILYPRQNPKILAGLLVLHLRYGINDYQEIMSFFLKEGRKVYEIARQQLTKLISFNILKKVHGKILFTSQGENRLQQLKNSNILIPLSIRAISTNWSIQLVKGIDSIRLTDRTTSLGKISTKDVLRKGLSDNLIVRNRQKYLVTDIDKRNKTVFVKKYFTSDSDDAFSLPPMNQLYDPTISVGAFPKKIQGTRLVNINFGMITTYQKPKIIANANPNAMLLNESSRNENSNYFYQELTQQESNELEQSEKSEGIIISMENELLKPKNLTTKKMLKLFGEILLIEIEMVLSIPASEFELVSNANQLAVYDKGEPNGNAEYLFLHLQEVAQQALKRLEQCSCERGCEYCYGEILGLLPDGSKEYLKQLVKDMVNISNLEPLDNTEVIEPNLQTDSQENRIIAFSDIHLTHELCYHEEFFEAISKLSKQADIIILNGDLLDKVSEESREAFNQLKTKAIQEGYWSKLVFIRSSSIHDGNLDQFSGFLHQDYVYIETKTEQVLFVHGNKIGIDANLAKSTSIEVAAIQAKKELIKTGRSWLPDITEETHLVIGHLHHRFYNERFRVYGLGHWLKKGDSYHQKILMIIDSAKDLDEIKLYQNDKTKSFLC